MDETRNLILAVTLSVLVVVLWQIFFVPEPAQHAPEQKQVDYSAPIQKEEIKIEKSRGEIIADSKKARVRISTKKLHGSISLVGASFDDLTLAGYRQKLDKRSNEVILLSPKNSKESYFVKTGWLTASHGVKVPDANSVWRSDKDELKANETVTLTWDNGQGLRFKKKISLDNNYMFSVLDIVENVSSGETKIVPYGSINKTRADETSMLISHEGPLGVFDEVLEEMPYDDLKDERKISFKDVGGWIGFADKYWLTAIVPSKDITFDSNSSYYSKDGVHKYQIDYAGNVKTLRAGEQISVASKIFAGAKEVTLIDKYQEEYKIPLFDRSVDYGWLYFITKPMFNALKFFYDILGNFGLAIFALTIIVRLILFPFATKSYKSMAQMRKVQPEMLSLRERYKNDKMKLNEEMMKFYKEKKINPMAGCMPMLVQIPIFFALYKVLYITIDMRHKPFYGWIKDLSAQDPTSVFNLFGLIPWEVPAIMPDIGVLPILFAITMFLQQMLNPPPTDPTQAMVMKWLPVIFLFIFAGFPAGLVLYWTFNNILSIAQQWIITKKICGDIAPARA